ncbi:MAG: inner membrane protein [Cellvibrionaceae bacterium]|jgi:inner membrane protein
MDPLTQGVIGAVAAQQAANKKVFYIASYLGFFAGMAADLDVFIRSNEDPLLALEFHRQFTHSLFFIPIGGLLCATLFYYLLTKRYALSFKQTYFYCTLGYATHGLLDACTTYGTQLLWPLSNMRVAWNTISIIDPLFTLPLLALTITAAIKRKRMIAHAALAWVLIYSAVGIAQRERAEKAGYELARSRGHNPIKLESKSSFANLVVWKIVYSTETTYYVDAVRVGLNKSVINGSQVDKLDVKQSFPWLDFDSQQAKDIERFRWFSNGYIALSPNFPNRIIDIRYSMLPNEIRGLWGIELNPSAGIDEHVSYKENHERNAGTVKELWAMIKGL